MDAPQRPAAAHLQRRSLALGGADSGAHRGQGLHHAGHGPGAQGDVSGQYRIEGLPRQQAGQQAYAGAGVAQIERRRRRLQPVQTNAVDQQLAVVRTVDGHTHGAKGRHCGQRILALEKAADPRGALRQRAEHNGPVRYRLVAGDPHLTGDGTAGQ